MIDATDTIMPDVIEEVPAGLISLDYAKNLGHYEVEQVRSIPEMLQKYTNSLANLDYLAMERALNIRNLEQHDAVADLQALFRAIERMDQVPGRVDVVDKVAAVGTPQEVLTFSEEEKDVMEQVFRRLVYTAIGAAGHEVNAKTLAKNMAKFRRADNAYLTDVYKWIHRGRASFAGKQAAGFFEPAELVSIEIGLSKLNQV